MDLAKAGHLRSVETGSRFVFLHPLYEGGVNSQSTAMKLLTSIKAEILYC